MDPVFWCFGKVVVLTATGLLDLPFQACIMSTYICTYFDEVQRVVCVCVCVCVCVFVRMPLSVSVFFITTITQSSNDKEVFVGQASKRNKCVIALSSRVREYLINPNNPNNPNKVAKHTYFYWKHDRYICIYVYMNIHLHVLLHHRFRLEAVWSSKALGKEYELFFFLACAVQACQ